MKYIYGPVPSRRLGKSLGISPIPDKTCNYTCIYCQLGRTTQYTNSREMFFPVEEIIDEVKCALNQEKDIDFITIVGEGEPLLYEGLGALISEVKELTSTPIAIITNGALLSRDDVRKEILEADVVLPTLDAYSEEMFRKINRPFKDIKLVNVIEGFREFRKIFKNQIWLEIMLIKDMNDDVKSLKEIRKLIDQIKVDRVYINVPIRPPAESWVEIPPSNRLIVAQEILKAESIAHFEELLVDSVDRESPPFNQILNILKRHPLRNEQVYTLFPSMSKKEIDSLLDDMKSEDLIEPIEYNNKTFWEFKRSKL
ncbi:MAG: radical SAM protein [Candidatus Heimdallarchaeota archaeon]|nr:radical SAM protein [Candidatus Heimdallarchaeota archaeon]